MEEVLDEEVQKAGASLPEGAGAILMTEEEYRNAIQEGEKPPPTVQKTAPKNQFTRAGSNSATKNTMIQEPPDNQPEIKPQTKVPSVSTHTKVQFAKTETYYCEPTSSKVKIEDLITAEQELAQAEEQERIEPQSDASLGRRSFWDRPIPKPQYEWPYDPRMPNEWNEVIASMQAYAGKGYPHAHEHYHQQRSSTTPQELTPIN